MHKETAARTIRILLVDDEDALRRLLKSILCQAGFGVSEATNGVEGLHLLVRERFDVVVTDIDMPFKDGLTMIEDAWVWAPEVTFIVYSSSLGGDVDRLEQLRAKNVLSVLEKPMSAREFVAAVRATLETANGGLARR